MTNKTSGIRRVAIVWFVALLALAGCGGGGGSASNGASSNGTRGGGGPGTVGGTVSGLSEGASVTLLNNGGDALTLSADGAFTFASTVASGRPYSVTVQSSSTGISCAVSNGSGTITSAAVTGVVVTCSAGVAKTVYAFGSAGTLDGQNPAGGLVMDSAGNFYGATQGGGDYGQGMVFKLTADGVLTKLYSFTNGSDGANPSSGLVLDSNGFLYGVTYFGGTTNYLPSTTTPTGPCFDTGCGTVYKISTAGTGFSVLHTFATAGAGNTALNDGRNPQGGLVLDNAGNLYGTTYYGGNTNFSTTPVTAIGPCYSAGCGTVYKVSTSGTGYSVLYRFSGGVVEGQYPQGSLVLDGAGYLYGTTSEGGFVDVQGTVFKLTTAGTNYSILHSFNGADGQKPLAGVLLDSSGYLYGTVSSGTGSISNGAIFKISTADNSFSLLYVFDGVTGKGPEAGLIMDSGKNLYGVAKIGGSSACTNGCGTVFKVTPAGVGSVLYSFGSNEGQNPAAALLLDSAGNIYGTTTVGIPISPVDAGYGNVFKI